MLTKTSLSKTKLKDIQLDIWIQYGTIILDFQYDTVDQKYNFKKYTKLLKSCQIGRPGMQYYITTRNQDTHQLNLGYTRQDPCVLGRGQKFCLVLYPRYVMR